MLHPLLFFLFFIPFFLSSSMEEVPVSYQGRFRPAEAYARLWIKEKGEPSTSALSKLKQREREPVEDLYEKKWKELQQKNGTPEQMAAALQKEFPLLQRLKNGGLYFKALPSKVLQGEWLPLKALLIQVYDPKEERLTPVKNFTSYSDAHFEEIRTTYKNWLATGSEEEEQKLSRALLNAYSVLAATPFIQAHGKTLKYPSLLQLKVETLYVSYPWIPLVIGCYSCTLLLLFLGSTYASFFFLFSLFLHTLLLVSRCYILGRPPVSNMFETVLYVPWIAACCCLLLPSFRKNHLSMAAASTCSIILLILTQITGLNHSLDQVQAVLDSQFWLAIHVLMIVGSYGIFILASALAHFYLISQPWLERKKSEEITQLIVKSLYIGTGMLIGGTLLGGVWAAQSWGRFWDWDPKESWAFISSALYIALIHLYRFHKIEAFGIAFGAVLGFLAISFTWYGVNYLLGTGLHSYGFGEGGNFYYYSFLILEIFFLIFSLIYKKKKSKALF